MSDINIILSENIRITAQVVTEICQRSTRLAISDPPLSRNQYYILKILATSGEFLIGELARILNISTSAASKNVDRLEQLDMVARQSRPGDRRSFEVKLLAAGQHVVDEFERVTFEKQKPLMAQFTDEEKHALLAMLQQVIRYTLAEESNTELICLQCGGNCGQDCAVEDGRGKCHLPRNKNLQILAGPQRRNGPKPSE